MMQPSDLVTALLGLLLLVIVVYVAFLAGQSRRLDKLMAQHLEELRAARRRERGGKTLHQIE